MNKELYYATTNHGKVLSLQCELEKHGITVVQVPLELPEPRSNDVQEIAREKVVFACSRLAAPVVALDAGFYISSLNGFPRAFVNFALETIGLEGILKLVEGRERSCEFRECLAYIDSTINEPKYFLSHVKGTLAHRITGEMRAYLWSRLGLIFIPEGSQQTLAEMSKDEYLEWRRIYREKNSSSRQFTEWISHNNK